MTGIWRRTGMAILSLASVCVIALSALGAWQSAHDFTQYFAAARLLVEGRGSLVYQPEHLAEVEHRCFPRMNVKEVYFCFPPYAMLYFAPLAVLPPQIAHYVWTVLSVAAYVGALVAVSRMFRLTASRAVLLGCLGSLTGPCCHAIIMGQQTLFILLGWSASLYALKLGRPFWAVVGLSVFLTKPHLALPILAFALGAGRYRVILTFLFVVLAIFLVSLLCPGIDAYAGYLSFLRYANANPEIMFADTCVTFRTQAMRLFPHAGALVLFVSFGVFVFGLALLFWLGRKYRQADWQTALALVALPVGFVTSFYVQPYDLMLFLPSAAAYGALPVEARPIPSLGLLAAVYMAVLVFPVYGEIWIVKGPINPLFWVVLSWTVLVILGAHRWLRTGGSGSGSGSEVRDSHPS